MSSFVESCIDIAKLAGEAIMQVYLDDDVGAQEKADHTPVTKADFAANAVLMAELTKLAPEIPIMSEETKIPPLSDRENWQRYWLLDPLDGTGEFILKSGDFAVSMALVENNQPVLGIIFWPAKDRVYWAQKGKGAFRRSNGIDKQIQVQRSEQLKLAVSRRQQLSTVSQYIDSEFDTLAAGSCAIKACLVAEGKADAFLRIGPTGEWDTGAAQIIIEEAGGQLLDAEFNPLSYNQREDVTNPDFMVLGDPSWIWHKLIKPHRRC